METNGAGVIYVVSNGWTSNWKPAHHFVRTARQSREDLPPNLFEKLTNAGFVVFIVTHGNAPRFTVEEIVGQVRMVANHVRRNATRLGIDAEKIGACGHSAGGHLSLALGAAGRKNKPLVSAVAASCPPIEIESLRQRKKLHATYPVFTKMSKERARRVSPHLHVGPGHATTLLLHGVIDQVVPIQHSEVMAAKLAAVNVAHELVRLEDSGHTIAGDDRMTADREIVEFFTIHLTR